MGLSGCLASLYLVYLPPNLKQGSSLINLPLNSAKSIKYSCRSDLFSHFTSSDKHNEPVRMTHAD